MRNCISTFCVLVIACLITGCPLKKNTKYSGSWKEELYNNKWSVRILYIQDDFELNMGGGASNKLYRYTVEVRGVSKTSTVSFRKIICKFQEENGNVFTWAGSCPTGTFQINGSTAMQFPAVLNRSSILEPKFLIVALVTTDEKMIDCPLVFSLDGVKPIPMVEGRIGPVPKHFRKE